MRLKPPTLPTLPFVMMPRPLQESNVVNKGGTAGFLGRAYDPYYLFPPGDDMDQTKMNRISVDDLQLRPEVQASRLERRGRLRDHFRGIRNQTFLSYCGIFQRYLVRRYRSRLIELGGGDGLVDVGAQPARGRTDFNIDLSPSTFRIDSFHCDGPRSDYAAADSRGSIDCGRNRNSNIV